MRRQNADGIHPPEIEVPAESPRRSRQRFLVVSCETNPAARGSYGLTNVELPVAKSPEPAAADSVDLRLQGNPEVIEIRKPSSEHEFFKKRSVSEISTLQMVEAVLSFSEERLALGIGAGGAGIEREAKLAVEVIEE